MKYRFRIFSLIGLIALCGCEQSADNQPKVSTSHIVQSSSTEDEIFYLLFTRSFYDTNGDDHGDLNGIAGKLDYIQQLGITSILLLPLHPSKMYHNYFSYDFEGIDPELGTLEDFRNLVEAVHSRGMKIYLDTEYQYVTMNHKWYRDALNNPESEYTSYLKFNGQNNSNPESGFLGMTEGFNYDGNYFRITTVNLNSTKVKEYVKSQFAFWTDPNKDGNFEDGVDGFRIDHMMDNLDGKGIWTDLFTEFWRPIIMDIKKLNPNVKFIAEQADWNDLGVEYFTKAGIDIVYGFGSSKVNSFNKALFEPAIKDLNDSTSQGKFQFLFNEIHDVDRFATDTLTSEQLRLAPLVTMLGRGLPLIYYGQELGMKGKKVIFQPNDGGDIARREAFEWYSNIEGEGMALWYKDSGPWWDSSFTALNDGISVEEQIDNPNSLLSFYKRLLNIRKNHEAFSNGQQVFIENGNSKVTSYIRRDAKSKIFVSANLSAENAVVRIPIQNFPFEFSTNDSAKLLSDMESSYALTNKYFEMTMKPYGYLVIQLE